MLIAITAIICLLPCGILAFLYCKFKADADFWYESYGKLEKMLMHSQQENTCLKDSRNDAERELKGAKEVIDKSNAEIAAYRDEPERYDIYPLDNVVHVVAYHKGYMSIVRSFRHGEHGESYAVMRAIETVEFLTDNYR